MTKIKRKLLIVLGLAFALLIAAGCSLFNVAAADDSARVEAESLQLNHMRFPSASDPIGSDEGVAVYWEADAFSDELTENSFIRIPVSAESAGSYAIGLGYYADGYPVRVYVNGQDNYADVTLPGNSWAGGTSDVTVDLRQGNNVVLIAVRQYGCIDYITLPAGLSLISAPAQEGYAAADGKLQAVSLGGDIFDAEALLYTQPLRYDSNPQFISQTAFTLQMKQGDCIIIDYYVSSYDDGQADLGLVINGISMNIDLAGSQTNTRLQKTISADELAVYGLMDGANAVAFRAGTKGQVGLYSFKVEADPNYSGEGAFMTKSGAELVSEGYITLRGRSMTIGDSVTFDWSGSGFAFYYTLGQADGTGVVRATITTINGARIGVFVDGGDKNEISLQSGTSTVVLAAGLQPGTHKIEVIKLTEANGSLAQLDSLSYISGNGTQLSEWDEPDYKMLVIGGSVSCGNQIFADGTEDASYSYPVNLARAYNMDWQTISCSGRGLMQGYNSENGWKGTTDGQLQEMNGYVSYFRELQNDRDKQNTQNWAKWNYSDYDPDVIIINAGGNDLGSSIIELTGHGVYDFFDRVQSFSTELRKAYPDSLIMWFYGTYINRAYKDEYQKAIDDLNDPNIRLVYTPQWGSGAADHPNVEETMWISQLFSEEIAQFLGIENPMPVYNGADREYRTPAPDVREDGITVSESAVYNDFDGSDADDTLVMHNYYHMNYLRSDAFALSGSHSAYVYINNYDSVNHSTWYHYLTVKPANGASFDASGYRYLRFKVFAALSDANPYLIVTDGTNGKVELGMIDQSSSVGSWVTLTVDTAAYPYVDWSAITDISFGFAQRGYYYIDDVVFANAAEVSQTVHTVTFDSNDGSGNSTNLSATSGEKSAMSSVPVRDGYVFTGWYTDAAATQKYDFTSPVTGDLHLYAGWRAAVGGDGDAGLMVMYGIGGAVAAVIVVCAAVGIVLAVKGRRKNGHEK